MTVTRPEGVAVATPSTEGRTLRQRALHELERQWLSDWSAARQSMTAGHNSEHEPELASSGPAYAPPRDGGHPGPRDRMDLSSPVSLPMEAAASDEAATELARSSSATSSTERGGHAASGERGSPGPDVASAVEALRTAAVAPFIAAAALPSSPGGNASGPAGEPLHFAQPIAAAPLSGDPTPPQPWRLQLREQSDGSVLASMRDAHLSAGDARAAAQCLARALMETGYARVQVVVNGQRQSHAAQVPDQRDSLIPSPLPDAEAAFPHPQELPHGY